MTPAGGGAGRGASVPDAAASARLRQVAANSVEHRDAVTGGARG